MDHQQKRRTCQKTSFMPMSPPHLVMRPLDAKSLASLWPLREHEVYMPHARMFARIWRPNFGHRRASRDSEWRNQDDEDEHGAVEASQQNESPSSTSIILKALYLAITCNSHSNIPSIPYNARCLVLIGSVACYLITNA